MSDHQEDTDMNGPTLARTPKRRVHPLLLVLLALVALLVLASLWGLVGPGGGGGGKGSVTHYGQMTVSTIAGSLASR